MPRPLAGLLRQSAASRIEAHTQIDLRRVAVLERSKTYCTLSAHSPIMYRTPRNALARYIVSDF